LTLSGPAPDGGAAVTLSSDTPAVASVPASVTVAAGATSASFSVTTTAVTSGKSVVISAVYNSPAVTATLTVTPPAAPAAPSAPPAGATSPAQINLLWTDNSSDEIRFELERKTGNGSFQQVATVGPNTTLYSDTGLTPGTAYTYRVRSVNSTGPSAYSNEATATTQAVALTALALNPDTVTGGAAS